ncbi:flagellar biosynthetic protein FliR [Microvirga guangxiensis]|uniref:Flagellar biosynthetic protein FliR n=1 Tax=Microvirga guangxiensis TaxID=549386 RepID=A0A1G5CRM9_9HYPH|nr:flagellar biosynthetic protein FliR [Microvirga guangxiensis]
MNQVTTDALLGVFLIFCRVGGCMLIAPALSSSRIPPQIRLFLALTVSLSLAPILLDKIGTGIAGRLPTEILTWIISETLVGLLIGLLGRVYFFALQTMLSAVSMALSYGGMPGTPMDDAEPLPAVSSLIMMVATAAIFLSDLHWELIKGLIGSYSRMPAGQGIGLETSLAELVDQVGAAFIVALRISSPFLLYSVIVNLVAGLANKLTPQIPVFFIATPFIMLGGLFIMYFAAQDYVLLFMEAFATWLKG